MPGWLDRIAERRMLKARAEGKLSNLAGEGRPLPDRPEAAFVDPGDAVGFRIMAEAGALPEEILIARQIDAARAQLATLTDDEARRHAQARIADLEMRRAMAAEARRKFLKG